MSILNTPALWYALTIPVIVLLYFLRLKRRELVVPSTLLWQNTVADVQANAPFQRLRRSLLLFLQILFLALLVFAVTRPFLRLRALTGRSIVLVVDSSASMQATDVAPDRLAAARKEALRIIEDLSRGDQLAVLEAADRTQVRTGLTQDKRVMKRAVGDIAAHDTATNLQEALVLARSLLPKPRTGDEVVILSDGAFPPVENLPTGRVSDAQLSAGQVGGEAETRFVMVGQSSDNVGIVAMDARRDYSARAATQVFVQMRNYSLARRDFTLELYREGGLVEVRRATLGKGAVGGETFEQFPYESGLIEARIDVEDQLAVDNRAYSYLVARRDVQVQLVSDGNPFLQRALEADPHVRVTVVKPESYMGHAGYDLTIFDRYTPDKLEAGGAYLLVAAAPQDGPALSAGEVARPAVVEWERTHPVTRYTNLQDLQMASSLALQPATWAKTLVDGDTTPLVICGESRTMRAVLIGFDILQSTLPKLAAFPILVQNSVEWLTRSVGEVANRQVRTGDAVPLDVVEGARTLVVEKPDRTEAKLPVEQQPVLFDDTQEAGPYRVRQGRAESCFVANLLSKDESNIAPQKQVSVAGQAIASGTALAEANRELWRFLATVGLLILALEWWVYHRRL